MKKALLILGGVLLLTLGAVGLASANAGPHGNYGGGTSTPDGCAGCHRAHTATGPYLLAAASPDALCEICHGATGNTDVFDGLLTNLSNRTLNGGGFRYMGGTTTSHTASVTSKHDVAGVSGTTVTAWGSNPDGAGSQGQLECVSCHNPHGSSNYRILNDSGTWAATPSAGVLTFQSSQVVTISAGSLTEPTGYGRYGPGSWDALSNTYYTKGINDFCSTCHEMYLTKAGSATNPSSESAYYYYPGKQDTGSGATYRYRHQVSVSSGADENNKYKMLRFAATNSSAEIRDSMTCLTCHFAHGTSATAETYSAAASPAGDSANLLYDNRG
ncbi:MAG: hypothetical protein M1358_10795, partial [Chloroflexi bacterium]|nr:hypothetical protein [Chloroflexota bacterium]